MKFIIRSNYTDEVEAGDEEGAIEKWILTIEDRLGESNETLLSKLCDSLYATKVGFEGR